MKKMDGDFGPVGFFVGITWCIVVFAAYHFYNTEYYAEKINVFLKFLTGGAG